MLGKDASARDATARSTVHRGQALSRAGVGEASGMLRSIWHLAHDRSGRAWVTALSLACLGIATIGILLFLRPQIIDGIATTVCPKWKSDVIAIECACREYARDHRGRYPAHLSDIVTPNEHGETYLEGHALPLDPWKRPYLYDRPTPEQATPRIYSLGRDGEPGGDGDDADVDNVMLHREIDEPNH
jgi:general secretion pathway protein G